MEITPIFELIKRSIMKKHLFSILALLALATAVHAQAAGQNPRAKEAYQAYAGQTGSGHAQSMGATSDQTYEAYDPMLIKEMRRQQRREFRQELRLERVRNRRFLQPMGPYGYYYWGW